MRSTRKITSPLLCFLVAAACSDGVVSPAAKPIEAPVLAAPAPVRLAPQGRPTLDLVGGLPDSTSVDFYVGPNGGVFYTGNHAVVFPSQSICDPTTSSYGPSTWDLPCEPLQTALKVHAEVRRANGKTWIDFTPSLRFVPSSSPSKWVWMVMHTPGAVRDDGPLALQHPLVAIDRRCDRGRDADGRDTAHVRRYVLRDLAASNQAFLWLPD